MRRFALSVVTASLAAGCFVGDDHCRSSICPPLAPDPCEGPCAPYIGGEWSAVLAASADTAPPPCPVEVAPFETMSSSAPPVTACGVLAEDGACSARGFVCLPPVPPPWAVCVLRDGLHPCPDPYPARVEVDSAVTVCCVAPPGEPS